MKTRLILSIACLTAAGCSSVVSESQVKRERLVNREAATVFFSPKGGCTDAIVREINAAKTSIYIQAYSFTSQPIAEALVEAHNRGVRVSAILDKSQKTANYSSADFVAHAGIETFIDAKHAIAHNKVMVIDEAVVLTGSFNFTKAAEESNAENLLVLLSEELAKAYLDNWRLHVAHSANYQGR